MMVYVISNYSTESIGLFVWCSATNIDVCIKREFNVNHYTKNIVLNCSTMEARSHCSFSLTTDNIKGYLLVIMKPDFR